MNDASTGGLWKAALKAVEALKGTKSTVDLGAGLDEMVLVTLAAMAGADVERVIWLDGVGDAPEPTVIYSMHAFVDGVHIRASGYRRALIEDVRDGVNIRCQLGDVVTPSAAEAKAAILACDFMLTPARLRAVGDGGAATDLGLGATEAA